MVSTELTTKLKAALRGIGRQRCGIDVFKHPDGSIMAMRNGSHLMTLEQGENSVKSFSASSIGRWARKIDAHLSKYSRGDYHAQHKEVHKYNRELDEKKRVNRKEEFIKQFEINKEKARRAPIYFY